MKKRMLISSLVLTGTLLLSANAFAQQQRQQGQQQNPMIWQQETVQGQSAALTIAPSTVRQIQLQLNRAGFDPGDVDGAWGQGTSNALANFQRTYGLEPTGQINLNTLQALGISIGGQQQSYGVAPQFGQQGGQFQQRGGQFQGGQQGYQQPQFQGGQQQGYQQPQFQDQRQSGQSGSQQQGNQ